MKVRVKVRFSLDSVIRPAATLGTAVVDALGAACALDPRCWMIE